VKEKMKKIGKYILMCVLCCSILCGSKAFAATEEARYVRVNPGVTVTQLEDILKQTGITVYTNKNKQKIVTQGNLKTGMFMISDERPEGKEIAVRGDVNADGRTDQIDLSYLIRYIIGISGHTLEGVYYEAGDFKRDGSVNQIDLTNIIRYIIYGTIDTEANPEPEPGPGPGPEPGEDTTPPEMLEIQYSTQNWTNQDVKVTMKWQDSESGIVAYQIQVQPQVVDSAWHTITATTRPLTLNTTITENGSYYVFVKNADGKMAQKEIKIQNIDKEAPSITLTQTPNTGKIQVAIKEEASGVSIRKYAKGEQNVAYFKDRGTSFTGTQVEVTENGVYTIYVQDKAGNASVKTIQVTIKQFPTITEPEVPGGGSIPGKEGESTEVVLTPTTDVTVDTSKFVPVDKDGNPIDATIEVEVGEDGKVHITVTGGKTEGEVHVKVLPGALTDAEGKRNEEFIVDTRVVIDNTKPGTEIVDKPEDPYVKDGNEISITINPGENVTVDPSKIKVTGEGAEGSSVDVKQNADGTVTIIVVPGTGNGNIQIEVGEGTFTDASGNKNESFTVEDYIVDTVPPTITDFKLVPPTTTSTITVKVLAQDNHADGLPKTGAYEYHISTRTDFLDEVVMKENTGDKVFTGLAHNTLYYIKVIVRDIAGNTTESNTLTATTTEVPEAEQTITFSESQWNNEKASIRITKKQQLNGYKVQYQIKDADGNVVQDWTNLEENSKLLTGLLHGNIIIAHVIDESGNSGSTVTASIIDAVAPEVTVEEQEEITQGNVTVTVTTIERESGIAVKKYAKGKQTEDYFETAGTSFTGTTFEVAENGIWTVYVEDKAGNKTIKTINVTKQDNEKPKIEKVELPFSNTTIREGEKVTIILIPNEQNITIDKSKFAIVNGAGNAIDVVTKIEQTADGKIHIEVTAGKQDGELILKLEAGAMRDQAGNISDKSSIPTNTIVNNQGPSANIKVPADKPVIKNKETTTAVIMPNVEGATVDVSKIEITGDGAEGATFTKTLNADTSITITITGGRATGDIDVMIQPGGITDTAGRLSGKITLPITKVDNTGPNVSLAVTNVTTDSITVKATAEDVGAAGIATEKAYTFVYSSNSDFGGGRTFTVESNEPEATFSGLTQNTAYYIRVEVKDAKGNSKNSNVVTAQTGRIPASDANIQFSSVIWQNGTASVTISKAETIESKIGVQYKIEKDGTTIQDWQLLPKSKGTITSLENGSILIARLVDEAGNYNGTKTLSIIDNTPPSIILTQQDTLTSGNVRVTAIITDEETGVAVQKYALGNQSKDYFAEGGTEFTGSLFAATENGIWTVYAEDVAGNKAIKAINIIKQDTTRPIISEIQAPTDIQAIKQGEKVTITLIANKDVTIVPNKFVPVDENGERIDALVKVTQDTTTTMTVEITAGTKEGNVYLKLEEGALADTVDNKSEERTFLINTMVDNTKPVITVDTSSQMPVILEGETAIVSLDISEETTLEEEKIHMKGAGSEGTSMNIRLENKKLILTIVGGAKTGYIDIELEEGALTDVAGNKNAPQTIKKAVAVDNAGPNIEYIELVETTTTSIKIHPIAEDIGAAGLAPENTFVYKISDEPNFEEENTYQVTYKENVVKFTGLEKDTLYYIQVTAKDALGNRTVSDTKEITTANLETGENSVNFSDVTWENHKGKVTIQKGAEEEASYILQYKVLKEDGSILTDWTNVEGDTKELTNIENGSILYARLTDGTYGGGEKSKRVKDTTAPKFVGTPTIGIDEVSGLGISVNMKATDENGLSETEPYCIYYKKTSDETFQKVVTTKEQTTLKNVLEPMTEYVVYLEAKDYFGNTKRTEEITFATKDIVARMDGTLYMTLQAAFNAVPEGASKTVEILRNAEESATLQANKTVTLNMSSKTIKGQIQTSGALTIQNGGLTAEDTVALHIHETGTAVLKEGAKISSTGTNQAVTNFGVFTLEGGTVEAKRTAIYTVTSGRTNIRSGEVKALDTGYDTVRNEGNLQIAGGTIYAQTNGNAIANVAECTLANGTIAINAGSGIVNTGTFNMTGGIIEVSADGKVGIQNENVASITGGNIHGGNQAAAIVNKKELTIEGQGVSITGGTNLILTEASGTTNLKSGDFHGTADVENAVAIYNKGNTQITGGTYVMDKNLLIANEKTLAITAGSFSGPAVGNTTILYNTASGTADISGGSLLPSNEGQGFQNYGTIHMSGSANLQGEYTLVYNHTATSMLQITGGTINGTRDYTTVYNEGTVNMSAGTLNSIKTAIHNKKTTIISGGSVTAKEQYAIYTEAGATTTITAGNITGEAEECATIWNQGYTEIKQDENNPEAVLKVFALRDNAIRNAPGGQMIVSEGDIQSDVGVTIYNEGTLTTKETIKETTKEIKPSVIGKIGAAGQNVGTWNIQGGTITASSVADYAVQNFSGGTVNMSGGVITATTMPIGNQGEFNLSGGRIESVRSGQTIANLPGGKFTMTGGRLLGKRDGNALIGNTGEFDMQATMTYEGGIITTRDGGVTNLTKGTLSNRGNYNAVYTAAEGITYLEGGHVTCHEDTTYTPVGVAQRGKMIANSGTVAGKEVAIGNAGELIVGGSSWITSKSGDAIKNNGTTRIIGGHVVTKDSSSVAIWNNGSLLISGGSVYNDNDHADYEYDAVYVTRSGSYSKTGGYVGPVHYA